LTQRRQLHTGEVTGLAVQVRLVGIAGAGGYLDMRKSLAQ
jgi:hypothetical protein